MASTAIVDIYYKLVKANQADLTKGRTIDQVPENIRAEVQAKLDAVAQPQPLG